MIKKYGLFFCLLWSVLGTATAQCLSGDCRNGSGVYLYPGARYVGQFKNGQASGSGSMYYADGGKQTGEWALGKPNGKGTYFAPDGQKKEGIWRMGEFLRPEPVSPAIAAPIAKTGCISGDCQNGQGVYLFPGGAVYIGEFLKGEISGAGICYYLDGSKYQGEWNYGYPEGRGAKQFPDGKKWTGKWKKGMPVGENGATLSESAIARQLSHTYTVQSGCIRGNCENGKGLVVYPDGSRYEGDFLQNKPHGEGVFHYPNGDRYNGQFRNGLRNGAGRLSYASGGTAEGLWRDGELAGSHERKGCVEGDCIQGFGTYIFQDGAKYIGTFKNNYPDGRGIVLYANGEKYEGQMAGGAFNGYGQLSTADGVKFTGIWENGVFAGARPQKEPIAAPPARLPNQPKVWAVIVGVSAYDHMPALKYPDDDAYLIYAFLKSPIGGALPDEQIRILVDEDATHYAIQQALKDLFWQAGPDDLVFLYFSGHGLPGAFLPIDYDGEHNLLYHEEITTLLNKSNAKIKLCFADACHSGSLLALKGSQAPGLLQRYYDNLTQAKPGQVLIMSSKSDETSLESSGLRQGVFSHYLIRGLKGEGDANRDGAVTIKELFDFIQTHVRTYTGNRQSPVIQGNYDPTTPVAVVK